MNTKTKHTPGPWAMDGDFIRDSNGDYLIAKVAFGDLENTANARLISAAPELLEACKLVDRAHCGDGVQMSAAVDACLLAISKAEGQI